MAQFPAPGSRVLKVPQREKRMLMDMARNNLASHMEADLRSRRKAGSGARSSCNSWQMP